MSVTTYNQWVADGKPWKNCQPINDFIAMLYSHGYTGPTVGIGDQSHLTATPPEDHCPYSHTPWPGVQPYPYVMAIDIMPGEGIDIIDLGGRLFNDKSSNKTGTQPIKYMNWTDEDNNCFHDSWMPNHTRFNSTDRGHIHISFRTDFVTSSAMAFYDPYGADMTPDQSRRLNNIDSINYYGLTLGQDIPVGQFQLGDGSPPNTSPLPVWAVVHIKTLEAQLAVLQQQVTDLEAKIDNLQPGGGGTNPGNYTITFEGTGTAEVA